MSKIFRHGKYKGKKADYVSVINPGYYKWAIQNAPNLIVDDSIPKYEQTQMNRLSPNLNFDNESHYSRD